MVEHFYLFMCKETHEETYKHSALVSICIIISRHFLDNAIDVCNVEHGTDINTSRLDFIFLEQTFGITFIILHEFDVCAK